LILGALSQIEAQKIGLVGGGISLRMSNLPLGGDLATRGKKEGKMERSLLIPLAMRDLKSMNSLMIRAIKASEPVY
jgi:hypothetical protein